MRSHICTRYRGFAIAGFAYQYLLCRMSYIVSSSRDISLQGRRLYMKVFSHWQSLHFEDSEVISPIFASFSSQWPLININNFISNRLGVALMKYNTMSATPSGFLLHRRSRLAISYRKYFSSGGFRIATTFIISKTSVGFDISIRRQS